MFIGGDSKTVRVLLDNGQVTEIQLDEGRRPSSSARKPPPPPPRRSRSRRRLRRQPDRWSSVPAGTAVNVRLTQAIDVDASQAGQTFKAIVEIRSCSAGPS